jgi:hypothetical protein
VLAATSTVAPGRWRWDTTILVGLPLAQLLEDLLTVRVGPVYFSAVKLTLFVGGLVMLKHCHPHVLTRTRIASPFLSVFLLFGALQAVSVLYSDHLLMSERVNYLLYHATGMVIVYGLARAMAIGGYAGFLRPFRGGVRLIFYSSLVLGTAQLILRDQIIRNIGGFPDQLGSPVVGFNIERLFLCEFLALGLANALLERGRRLRKVILIAWTVAIVFASGSVTGMLGLGLVAIVVPSLRISYISMLALLVIATDLFLVPVLRERLLPPEEVEYLEYRYQTNVNEYQQKNWRYWSSMLIVNEALMRPTLFGHGYKESEKYLSEAYGRFYEGKHGREDVEHRVVASTHTFLSTIHDQGTIGFSLVVILLLLAGNRCLRLISFHPSDMQLNAFVRLAVILTGLMLLRMLLYYHSLYRWHFLVAAVFLNAAWYWTRRERRAKTVLSPA